jgi:hypothetical protein
MPVLFLTMMCLFLYGTARWYWLVSVPLLMLFSFMNTLADIHDIGNRFRVNRWWSSVDISKSEITQVGPSFLEGIGVLRLRRFIFPWGPIYFVAEWSDVPVLTVKAGEASTGEQGESHNGVRDALAACVLAVSGFASARVLSASVRDFRIESAAARIVALVIAGSLCVLFALTWAKKTTFANVVLFAATWIAGLARW